MELVEATLTPRQRLAGLAWVPWRDVADQQARRGEAARVLTPGDDVLLRVEGHTVHRGRVLRYDEEGAAYVITVGAPMAHRAPRRPATRRARPRAQDVGVPDAGVQDVGVQDVRVRVVPAQRTERVSLYL